ncbi:MAG: hypothetical protein Q9210_005609 [Variospora velana]
MEESSTSSSSSSSRVTSITVRAHWDGVQEHPGTVFVRYMIEAQPGTCLGLIKTNDPAVEVVDVHSTVYGWSEAGVGQVEEKDGDVLTTIRAEAGGHDVHDQRYYGRDSGFEDTTSPSLLSPPAEQLHVCPEGEVHRRHRSRSWSTASSSSTMSTTWPTTTPASQSATLSLMSRSPGYDRPLKYYGPKPLFVSLALVSLSAPRIWLNRFCSAKAFRLPGVIPCDVAALGDISEDDESATTSSSDPSTSFDFAASSSSSSSSTTTNAADEATTTTIPSTVLFKDSLCVCFPRCVRPGVFEVQLDMKMFLSQPDALGWRDFSLPSLLTEPEADADGFLEFSLGAELGAMADTTIQGMTSCDQFPSDAWPHETSLPSTQFDCNGCVLVEDEQDGWLKGTFLTTRRLTLRMRWRATVHHLEHWNSAVTIYSTTSYESGRGMEIRHSASLTIAPQEEIFAERVVFAVLIRNGPRESRTYRLEPGQCWMQFSEDVYDGKPQDRGAVEIFIERDIRDMDKRLGLEFTCRYPSEKALVHLPTVSPRGGKVLSERIWLLEPMAPLKLHAVCKRFLSTWQVSKRALAKRKLLCFDRIEVSRFYPVGFVDDAVVQIRGALSLSRSCDGFGGAGPEDECLVVDAAGRSEKLAARVENIRFAGGVPLQPRKVRFDDEGSATTSSEDEDAQSAVSSAGEDEGSGSDLSSDSESSEDQGPMDGDNQRSASDGMSTVGENNTENHDRQDDAENEEDRADFPGENDSQSDSRSDAYSYSFGDSSSASRSGEENSSSDDSEDHALEEMVEDLARSILKLVRSIRRSVRGARRQWGWALAAFFWLLGRLLWRLFQGMPRKRLMRYLLYICILCIGVPWAYLGGVHWVVSDVGGRDPGAVYLGDGEMFVGGLGAGRLEGGIVSGEVVEEEIAAVAVLEVREPAVGEIGWRDRIDLALGWRPVP